MRIVDNFKLFKKIQRKFYKKHCVKRIDHINGKRFVSFWEESDWLGYRVNNEAQLNSEIYHYIRLMVGDECLNNIKIKELLGCGYRSGIRLKKEEYKTPHKFNGVMLTNRDAYAILEEYDEHGALTGQENLYPMWLLIENKTDTYTPI